MERQSDKKFTWVINNFSSQSSIQSDIFVVGGCRWYLLAFPKGVDCKPNNFSLYLVVANCYLLPSGWRRHAKISLTIVNQFSDKLSQHKETQQWFSRNDVSCGFEDMIALTKIHAREGFLVNGELIVVVKVDVLEVEGRFDTASPSSPVMETIDVNGFEVLPSQVESVKRLFERHQDIASRFRPTNPYLKTAYMNVLLSLIQTLHQSPQEISKDDLADKYAALSYLTDAGFQLEWLGKKLDEVEEKKKKEKAYLAQLQEMEEQLQPLKQKCSDMEAQMDKVKAELSASSYPVSLNDEDVV